MSEEPTVATGRRQRRIQVPTLVAGLVVGALLAGGIVPFVGDDGATPVASEAPGFLAGGDDAVSSGDGRDEASTDGEFADGSGASGDDTPGFDATGNAAGVGAGTGASAPTGAGSVDEGGTAATPTEAVTRTASDVGITETTIRVGAMTLNCKACAALGVTSLDNVSHTTIAKAFIDEINARGGINGRKLELFTSDYDPAEDAVNGGGTERAACIELTERRRVFAVLSGGVFANACVYDEHKTLMITMNDTNVLDPDTFNRNDGRLWLVGATSGRILLDWARQLDGQQLLRPSTKFGIVVLDGPHRQQVERYLLPELRRLGYTPAHTSILPNDAAQLPVKAASEVPAMRGKGVTHVLVAAEYVAAQTWIRESQRNAWKPQYLQSDFPSGAHDYQGGQNSQAGDWAGAIALSTIPEMTSEEVRRNAVTKRCLDIYERSSGRRTSQTLLGWVFNYCNYFRVFELAVSRAGANPTRRTFAQAMASLGRVPVAQAFGDAGVFGGQYGLGSVKWSAATHGQRKVWQKPCPRADDADSDGCYVPVGPVYGLAA